MYAIIETGGKQYRAEKGDTIQIEKIKGLTEGDSYTFEKVLMVADGEGLDVGRPYIDEAKVEGNVVESGREEKVTVYKYKKRKGYRRKYGHRQPYMKVEINEVQN